MYLPVNRETSRWIAWLLITIGVIISPDIVIPTFTDFINVGMAMVIADLSGISYYSALMMTFTLGFTLIGLGLLIYPYNTKKLMISKIKIGVKFIISHPVILVCSVVFLLILYWYGSVFYDTMYQTVKDYAMHLASQMMQVLNGGVV